MNDTTCDHLIAAHERIGELRAELRTVNRSERRIIAEFADAAHRRIRELEAENERLWRMSCEGYAIDSQVHDDLKALVRGLTGDGIEEVTAWGHRIGVINVCVSDFRKLLTPRILEWAGVE